MEEQLPMDESERQLLRAETGDTSVSPVRPRPWLLVTLISTLALLVVASVLRFVASPASADITSLAVQEESSGDPKPFKNVELITRGYNIYYADPAPAPKSSGLGGEFAWLNMKQFTASQSSTSWGGSASRGIDGSTARSWYSGSCTHTGNDQNPWWKVDFGEDYTVASVKIANRQDCCQDRLSPFDLYIGDTKCASGVTIGNEVKEVKCEGTGKSLKIQVNKKTEMTVCEVSVLGYKGSPPPDDAPVSLLKGSAQCEAEQKDFGNIGSRLACAEAISATQQDCGDTFMYSPSGGCRCCKPEDKGKSASGWELFKVNKGADLTEMLNIDPGVRKPVFAITYGRGEMTGDRRSKQPDGYHATVDIGCSSVFTSKSIRDEYEFIKETSREVSLTAGVEASIGVTVAFPPSGDDDDEGGDGGDDEGGGLDVGVSVEAGACISAGASGTLSHKNSEMRGDKETKNQRMERSVAKCASYVAAIEYGNFPTTHPDFQAAVDAAGVDAEKYYDIFDDFGTHFMTTVKMGARHSVTTYFRNDQYESMVQTIKGFGVDVGVTASASAGVSAGVSVGPVGYGEEIGVDVGVEAGASLLSPKEKKAVDTMKKYIQKSETSAMGPPLPEGGIHKWWAEVNDSPVPIRSDRREICLHPVFNGETRARCRKHLKGYCDGRLKKKGAPCTDQSERECFADLECKENHLCRKYKCVKAPECVVKACNGHWSSCSDHYKFDSVYYHKNANGVTYRLDNGDWLDKVKSFQLSDGCDRIEAVDDDGACQFGKRDNRWYSGSSSLPNDLENDVCMIKVYAKPLQEGRRLEEHSNSSIPGLAELNARLAKRREILEKLGSNSELALPPPGATVVEAEVSTMEKVVHEDASSSEQARQQVVQAARAKLLQAEATFANRSLRTAGRQLGTATSGGYVKNIGKAMYGYNHFYGAPLSSEYAGTDPGFQHRAVWADEYNDGKVASYVNHKEIPSGKGSSSSSAPAEFTKSWIDLRGYITSQSSTSGSGSSGKAIDGNDNRNWNGGSCTHTNDENNPWWEVDLGADYAIEKIRVANRKDCCSERLNNFNVLIDGKACAERVQIGNEIKEVACKGKGQILRISLSKKAPLTVCEVEIFGAPVVSDEIKYSKHPNMYLGGYAAGDSWTRSVAESQARCDELGSSCGGFTCTGDKCTVRASTVLTASPSGETTYKKPNSRRLEQSDGNSQVRPLHAGPPRKLGETLKVPDGWSVSIGNSVLCNKDFDSKEIKSDHAFQAEMADSFSLGLDIGFVSFGASTESKEFRKNNNKEKRMMVRTTAECLDYIAKIEDLENNPPPISPSFQFIVDSTKTEAEFYAFFDMFGLAFPTEVAFGARYGYTRYIDEMNYESFMEQSESNTLSAAVSYTVGVDKEVNGATVSAGVTVSGEVATTGTTSTKTRNAVKTYFEEVREFTVGKRMPDKGGVEEWVQNVGEEPMPTRFSLVSICEHPAFKESKTTCESFAGTYCEKHLSKIDPDLECTPPALPQCLFDLDCRSHHLCKEGTCVPEPACYVETFKNTNFGSSRMAFGPIYWRERPNGQEFDLGWMEDEISSLKISGGCREVVAMDEDKCWSVYEDNGVWQLKDHNNEVRVGSLKNDLDNDVCRIKVEAKKDWV